MHCRAAGYGPDRPRSTGSSGNPRTPPERERPQRAIILPMNEPPLVSIVVRTKDRLSLLREALASIAGQTFRPIEIIVVNDGGAPAGDVVRDTARSVPVDLIEHAESRGRSSAANRGIAAARGEWIGLLDDDDLYLSDHVETLLALCAKADAPFGYAACRLDRGGRSEVLAVPFDFDMLALANFIPTCAVLVRRDTVVSAGGFAEDLDYLEDWDLWLRIARDHPPAFTDTVTSVYRAGPASVGGDMAADRWNAMAHLFARHRELMTPERITARLRQLERDIRALRDVEHARNEEIERLKRARTVLAGQVNELQRALDRERQPPRWRRWLARLRRGAAS